MSEELVKKEIELIYEVSQDKLAKGFYKCKIEPTHNCDVHIAIPCNGINLKKIFQAEKLMREVGVSFDSGYGSGCRDWNFDWSLRGAYVKKRKDLTEGEQRANKIERILKPANWASELPCKVFPYHTSDVIVIIWGKADIFKELLEERLTKAGAIKWYGDFKKEIVNKGLPIVGSFIGYKLNDILIRTSYTGNKTGH